MKFPKELEKHFEVCEALGKDTMKKEDMMLVEKEVMKFCMGLDAFVLGCPVAIPTTLVQLQMVIESLEERFADIKKQSPETYKILAKMLSQRISSKQLVDEVINKKYGEK